jgi:hypothetical protein
MVASTSIEMVLAEETLPPGARSVEDGRLKGASPRPEKRADIAKKTAATQRRKNADFP